MDKNFIRKFVVVVLMCNNFNLYVILYRVRRKFILEPSNFTLEDNIKMYLYVVREHVRNSGGFG
jgi:hypothetical protein